MTNFHNNLYICDEMRTSLNHTLCYRAPSYKINKYFTFIPVRYSVAMTKLISLGDIRSKNIIQNDSYNDIRTL